MLSLEAIDAILSISEGELIEDIIITLLATPQLALFFEKYPRLKNSVLRDMPRWRERLKTTLHDTPAPWQLKEEIACYQQTLSLTLPQFIARLPEILSILKQLESPFFEQAQNLIAQTTQFTPAQQTLFLQRWRLSLVLQTTAIDKQLLADERDQLLAEIQQRLLMSSQLEPVLSDNDQASGRLWDMSAGSLKKTNPQLLLQYGDFLSRQPELIKLAEQLGRAKQAKVVVKKDLSVEKTSIKIREPGTVPEQIVGLHLSSDILRLLPAELATLGIAELEFEFYRRLVEQQLVTYRLQGDSWREKIIEHSTLSEHTDSQPRGPFIVCVDTSGSMGGFNEQCAKAFCLALMRIALADNRRCFIMLFSSEVVQYELSGHDGIEQIILFLSQRFQGGTDLASCFRAIIEKMRSKQWFDADAVVISDFIAQRLPDELIISLQELQHSQKHRFHAVAMSAHGKPGIMRIFDSIWRFDTGLRSRLLRRLRP